MAAAGRPILGDGQAGLKMWVFVKYLMVGAINTIAGFAVIVFCLEILGLQPVPANAIGFVVGLVISFLLNRSFSFRSSVPITTGLLSFAVVAGAGYLVNLAALLAGEKILHLGTYPSQILGVSTYVLVVFFASRKLVFRDSASNRGAQS
jgi:putative flippase GtrA